jgi:hypothetical protein
MARNVYKLGFDFNEMQPLSMTKGTVIVKGILPSDFDQIVSTDHLNEMRHCKIWEVISVTEKQPIEKGDTVVILKAGIDGIDPDMPRYGILDVEDIRAKIK